MTAHRAYVAAKLRLHEGMVPERFGGADAT